MKTFLGSISAFLFIAVIGFFAVHAYVYFTHNGETQFNFEDTPQNQPKSLSNPCANAQSLQHCEELSK